MVSLLSTKTKGRRRNSSVNVATNKQKYISQTTTSAAVKMNSVTPPPCPSTTCDESLISRRTNTCWLNIIDYISTHAHSNMVHFMSLQLAVVGERTRSASSLRTPEPSWRVKFSCAKHTIPISQSCCLDTRTHTHPHASFGIAHLWFICLFFWLLVVNIWKAT